MSDTKGFAPLEGGGRLSFSVTERRRHSKPILLHRPLGGSMQLWGELVTRLAAERQVVAFDPRGVGLSSDVPWFFTTRSMASDACALLDFLNIESAHVFGLSLGGMVASWMAIDAPARVESLALASTIPTPAANSVRGVCKALALMRSLALSGAEAEVKLVRGILSPQFRAAHLERVLAMERTVRAMPSKRWNLVQLGLAAAFHAADLGRTPAQLDTLLLFGALDPLAGEPARAAMAQQLRHAKLVVIADSGHDISLEQPAKTAEHLIALTNGASLEDR